MKEEETTSKQKNKDEINYDQLIKSNPMTPVEPTKFASISTAVINNKKKTIQQLVQKPKLTDYLQKLKNKAKTKITEAAPKEQTISLVQKLKLKAQAKLAMEKHNKETVTTTLPQPAAVAAPLPAPQADLPDLSPPKVASFGPLFKHS